MQRRALALASAIGLVGLLAVGCGGSGDGGSGGSASGGESPAARTIDVEMKDIAYAPTSVDVNAGEKVTFNFRNTGAIAHDAFIGDEAAQAKHGKDMKGMDHGKGSKNAVTVDPGKSASLTYTFDKPGAILVGCHQPGHYAAGMKIQVNIA